jgi:hypothetical protein
MADKIPTSVARLIRWRDTGDDPDPGYTAGSNEFGADVVALLALAGYGSAASRLDPHPPAPADAHPPRPDLGPDDTMEWADMLIKRKKDMHGWDVNIGYVVVENDCNPMPGATWFRTVADAQKGIAALTLARRIAPKADGDGCESDVFWMLLQLTGMRDN